MKILSVFRRYVVFACSLIALIGLATPAFATHLRGGTVTWRVTSTTSTTYTVQFTLIESSRWSYPGTAGTCGSSSQQTGTCPALNTSVVLSTVTGGSFTFGDGSTAGNPTGTVTSINQAEDYMTVTFVFSHTYTSSAQPANGFSAFFDAGNRISTLKIGHDQFEYINTIVSNYPNGSPTAATPAILAVPLESTATFNVASVVTDIDPNVNLTYRLATLAELYGPGVTSVPCPNASYNYTSAAPPGFTVSAAGLVTWNETLIAQATNGNGNCLFGTPVAGDLWPAQIMVEARNKVSGALITETPVDLMMKFVNLVGVLPTVVLNPSTTQTVAIGTPVAFTATANSNNAGAKVTLNANGIPSGATASGLNAAVTPPTTSNFSWTPGPGQDGTYVITYTVTDNNLQQATASNTIVVATLPTISCAAPINVLSGNTGTLTATVFDINQDPLNVVWSVDGTNVQTNSNVTAYPSPGATVQLQQTFGNAGLHSVNVTATDPHGVAVSCSTSVSVYQPTSLALASASGAAGGTVTLNATLTTSPDGVPVPNQMVTFSFAGTGAPSPVGAVTDANGVATVPVVFTTPGSFTATATFSNPSGYFTNPAGAIPPVADTATATVTVSQATTSLSNLSPQSPVFVGGSLAVSTTLSRTSAPAGPVAGGSVVFTLTAPGGAMTTASSTTDASGVASANFTPTTTGAYSLVASFAGNTTLQASTSATASVNVDQRTSLSLAAAHGTAGGPVLVSATLTNVPSSTPLSGQTVTFDFAGVVSGASAVTDANGVAAVSVVFPSAGSFPMTATFFNLAGFFVDSNGNSIPDTASGTATIQAATTSLSALNPPSITFIGSPITVSTTLSRVSAPSGAVNGATVTFTFTAPGGAVTTLNGLTDSNGLASASFTPTTGGAYSIAASFAGNAALLPVTSSVASVSVYQETSLAMPPVSGTAGNPLSVSATLTNIPSGTPLAGQTVTFSFSGGINNATATTDANGVATVVVTFPAAGTFSATASFQNVAGFFANSNASITATTVASQITVALATTSLSNLNYPLANVVGNTMTLSTTLTRVSAPSGPVSAVPVAFVYSVSGGAPVTLPAATTNANGMASVNFTPTTPGTYAFSAMFAGTNGLAASQVTGPVVSVYQRTSLVLASASGTAGSSVTLSATLTTVPGGVPLTNQLVSFSFSGTGAPNPVTAVTDASGVATVQPVFTTAGSFTATAAFSNPAGFFTNSAGSFPPVATTASASVTVLQATKVITFTQLTTPAEVNSTATLVATASNGDPVTFSVTSGSASITGSTITYTNAGTVVIAADSAGTTNYLAAPTVFQTVVVNPVASAYTAPTTAVGATSATQTVYVNITTAGTLGAINVVTQGATGLDFNAVTGGSCTVGLVYSAGQACSVEYSFAPTAPGQRLGAVVLTSSTPAVLGTSYLSGTGTGPLATFTPGTISTVAGSGTVCSSTTAACGDGGSAIASDTDLYSPYGVALDGAGNLYILDSVDNRIRKVTAATGIISTVAGNGTPCSSTTAACGDGASATSANLNFPEGIAIDGAGNLYIADTGDNRIRMVTAATGIISTVAGTGTVCSSATAVCGDGGSATASGANLNQPFGVVVDGAGNLYIADVQDNRIRKVAAATGMISTVAGTGAQCNGSTCGDGGSATASGATLTTPFGVVVDGAGNLFIADTFDNRIRMVTPGGVISTVAGTGYNLPYGITVDAAGNLYIADAGNNRIRKVTPGGVVSTVVGTGAACGPSTAACGDGGAATASAVKLNSPFGIAVDGAGNLYISDAADNRIRKVTATAAPVAFADTNVGSASSSNPQTVTVANNGYDPTNTNPLTLSSVSTGTANFLLDSANACTTSTSLEPGQTCVLAVDFTPQVSSSPLTDAVTLADNNLNNILSTSSPQIVPLSGNGLQQTPGVTVAPATIVYGTPTVALSANISFVGTVAPIGPVTFIVDEGSPIAASCTGTTSPLTCTAAYPTATLPVPTHTIAASIAATPGFLASSGTGTLTVNPAPLTVSIIGNPSKPYDGTTAATLFFSNYQVSGVVSPDAITVTQPSGTYAAAAAGSEVVNVLLASSNFSATSGSLSNYILPTSATGAGNISQAPTVTALSCPASITYSGAAQTPCTASVTGAGGLGQPVAVTYSSNLNAGVNTASATATYAGDSNYLQSTKTVNFTIIPAPLTVTAGNYSGTYDGATHAISACTASANPDGLTCTNNPVGPVGPDAGSGVVTPVVSGSTANYAVVTVNGSWSIAAKAVTITAGSYSGTYDGNAHAPSACTSNYAGVSCANSPASVGPTVGSGTTDAVASVVGGIAADYTITPSQGHWSITQATSTVTINCPTSVTYNGSAQTPCSATATGVGGLNQSVPVTYGANTIVGTASASASFTGDLNHTQSTQSTNFTITPAPLTVTAGSYSGTYDSATHALSACSISSNPDGLNCTNNPVGPVGPNVGSGTVSPVISGPTTNYTVTSINGSWSITPKAVTITAGSYSGTFDGNAHSPSACTSSYAGVTCANSPASVGSGAGSGTIVPVPTLVNGVPADYSLTSQNGSWSIAQAPSVTTISCPVSVVYNGSAQTPCTANVTGAGGLNQPVTITYSSNPNVGTVLASAPFSGDANHTGSTQSTMFTITAAPLTVTIINNPTKGYDGTQIAALGSGNYNVRGLQSGDSIVINQPIGTYASPNAGPEGITAVLGSGNFSSSTNSLGNYTLPGTASGLGTIAKAPLTASIINTPTKTYDGSSTATLTNANFSVTGFIGTDGVTVNTSTGTFDSSEAGSRTVSATIAATDLSPATGTTTLLTNYVLPNSAMGPGRVDPASQAITFTQPASPVVFGVAPIALMATGGASGNGVMFKVAFGPGSISANTLTVTGAGTIIVAADQAASNDYTAAPEVTQTVTVNPATPQLAFQPTGITYGTTLASNQINPSATGVAGTVLTGAGSFTYNPGLGTELKAGTDSVMVTFTPNDTTDYATATGNVSIQVSADQPTLALSSTPITYGTGFAASQISAVATGPNGPVAGTITYTVAAGTVLPAGMNTVGVTFTPTDNSDYTTVTGNVSLLVNKATLTVTAKNQSQVYGETPNLTAHEGTTFAYSGFMNGESSSALTGAPVLTTTETATSLPTDANGHPITYPITISKGSLSSPNYTFTFVGAQDTVLPTGTSVPASGNCAGVYQGGTYKGNINVGPGQVCILISNTVNGNIQQTGGIVEVIQTTVNGNFQINAQAQGNNPAPATSFQVTGGSNIQGNLQVQHLPVATVANPVCGSVIKGDLQYQQNGAPVLIGSALPSDGCAGNNIGGNLQIQQNSATVSAYNNVVGGNLQAQNNTAAETITLNTVNGDLQVQNNTASTTVNNNTVKGNLQDTDNTAPTAVNSNTAGNNLQCQNDSTITGGGNTAKSKQGQCAAF